VPARALPLIYPGAKLPAKAIASEDALAIDWEASLA
jgi:hypothetical protein